MSKLRAPGEPGRYMPAMAHICGHDGGANSTPTCGSPAIVHLFAGDPLNGPSDWTMFACDDHVTRAQGLAWDWHPVSAVCDIPGTMWHSSGEQGGGFCYWTEAEAAMHEAVSIELVTP